MIHGAIFIELLVGITPFSALNENRILKNFDKWGPQFKIDLEVFINSMDTPWATIIRFTDDNSSDCCEPGQRSPGIFFNPHFELRWRMDQDLGDQFDISKDVGLKSWFNLSISQYLRGCSLLTSSVTTTRPLEKIMT